MEHHAPWRRPSGVLQSLHIAIADETAPTWWNRDAERALFSGVACDSVIGIAGVAVPRAGTLPTFVRLQCELGAVYVCVLPRPDELPVPVLLDAAATATAPPAPWELAIVKLYHGLNVFLCSGERIPITDYDRHFSLGDGVAVALERSGGGDVVVDVLTSLVCWHAKPDGRAVSHRNFVLARNPRRPDREIFAATLAILART